MKIYETLTRNELVDRFKPIEIRIQQWPTPATMIRKITKRDASRTGKIQYTVLFKDGQNRKVPAQSLNESNKQLVEDFELDRFRLANNPMKERRSTRIISDIAASNNTSNTSSRDSTPPANKRASPFQIKYTNRKKIKFEPKKRADSTADSYSSGNSESENSNDALVGKSTTRSGRTTRKQKTWEEEFIERPKVKPIERYQYTVPAYTDEEFIKRHSIYCFKCSRIGNIHGPVKVVVGTEIARTRLLLCKVCSNATHNNCLPNNVAKQFDMKTSEFTCLRCIKKDSCQCLGCKRSLKLSGAGIPFRCSLCIRTFHNKCIEKHVSTDLTLKLKQITLDEFYKNGQCIECLTFGSTNYKIVAERMVKDKKEYMIKWENKSFRHTNWLSESWVLATNATKYRSYIQNIQNMAQPVRSNIPIEWTIVDRILDVAWADNEKTIAKHIFAVYKDLDYKDAIWDDPPLEEDTELWPDYQKALERYIKGTKVKHPTGVKRLIKEVRERAKAENYEKHELKTQPSYINGGKLMKHQMEALNWLLYQWENKQSCILADDMGLGKTIQIISYFYVLYKKYQIYPFICVVPNSTATNWIREFEKWAPEFVVAPFFGRGVSRELALKHEIFKPNGDMRCHVVVCTYESALEVSKLHRVAWSVMVVDESQRLKNDESLLFKTLRSWDVDQITLLTGTPLQNNLKELLNIMNFIQPKGFHGSEAERYKDMNSSNVEELHKRLRPYFLRRTKEEVLKTLPPKYELIVPLSMTPLQKRVYKECLSGDIHETLTAATGAKRQKGLSNIFMNLRKTLNHPYLLDGVETMQPTAEGTQTAMIGAAGKLKLFHQMFPKLKAQGHRILIFSTMTRVLDVLEDYLTYEHIGYARLDGSSSERDRVRSIDAFNDPQSKLDVFLLSTRAGGVGINLATADTVIIWDSDWNPYADLQAISRAHRIGQQNMVLILRLMTRLTIEEKVLQIGKKKMALEHVVVERMSNQDTDDKLDDIESILKYGAEALFADDDSKDIQYDAAAIDNLLDREKYMEVALEKQQEEIKEAEEGNKKAAEQGLNFAFAKVWKADGTIEELGSDNDSPTENNDEDFWEKFIKEKEEEAARKKEEKRLAIEKLGRGARRRAVVTYKENFKERKKINPSESTDEDFDPSTVTVDEGGGLSNDVVGAVPDDYVLNEETSLQELQEKVYKFKMNGLHGIPKAPPVPAGSENVQILLQNPNPPPQSASPATYQNPPKQPQQQQSVVQQTSQSPQQQPSQTPIHPCFTADYEERLYSSMLSVAAPFTQRIRNFHTKAFYENRHQHPEFVSMAHVMFKEFFSYLNQHFRGQFAIEHTQLQRNGTPAFQLDSIYKQQIELLTRHFSRLGKFFDTDIIKLYQALDQARQQKQMETSRLQESARKEQERQRREATQRQYLALVQAQQQQKEQERIRRETEAKGVQLRQIAQQLIMRRQLEQRQAEARLQAQARAQQEREAQERAHATSQLKQQQQQAQMQQSTALVPASGAGGPSSVMEQFQSLLAQVGGSKLSQKELFEQISKISAQAAEQARRKEEAEKLRQEAQYRAMQQHSSPSTAQTHSSHSPPEALVDATQVEVQNATYFSNVSDKEQKNIFNAPPIPTQPQPQQQQQQGQSNGTSSQQDQLNEQYGERILDMFKQNLEKLL